MAYSKLLFAAVCTLATLASAARVADPIFFFEFESNQCAAGTFKDSSVQAVYGDMTIASGSGVTCSNTRNGITSATASGSAALVVSTANSTACIAALDSPGSGSFTIELWLKHGTATSNKKMQILGISNQRALSAGTACDPYYSNFELLRDGADYLMMTGGGTYDCILSRAAGLVVDGNDPIHIVMTYDQDVFQGSDNGNGMNSIWINTVKYDLGYSPVSGAWTDPSSTVTFIPNYADTWVAGNKLELFGNHKAAIMPNDFAPWPGTIYSAAMYNYVLSTAEVAANYAAGDQFTAAPTPTPTLAPGETEAPTLQPTTAAPTTATPTAAPVTPAPTLTPTTAAPSTAKPTTAAPSKVPTAAPTTRRPTPAPKIATMPPTVSGSSSSMHRAAAAVLSVAAAAAALVL